MPTKSTDTTTYRKKTKVDDPNGDDHIVVTTVVKYSGPPTNRVKEIEAQVARAHSLIDEMDQPSLPLNKETEAGK